MHKQNLTSDARIELIQGDITKAQVDAIVNAANRQLIGGGGVDGAIRRAGGDAIETACARIRERQGGVETGAAVITTGGNLPAKYVIHTAGPVWEGGAAGEPDLLASCYRESLQLAVENGVQTIAFPSISTGIYGYPTEKAAAVALRTVKKFVASGGSALTCIQFILFDDATYQCYAEALMSL